MRKLFHICGFRKRHQRLKLKTNVYKRTKNMKYYETPRLKNHKPVV